jgi:hypothetical protein
MWDYKLLYRGHLELHHLPTKFHENPSITSKVISGGHTDRHTHTHTQTGDFINPLSFFESRLKKQASWQASKQTKELVAKKEASE